MDPLLIGLILGVIVGVVPLFFGLVFLSSRVGRVKDLRRRIAGVRLDEDLRRRHGVALELAGRVPDGDGLRRACERAGEVCGGLGRDPVLVAVVRECRDAEAGVVEALGKLGRTAEVSGVWGRLMEAEEGVEEAGRRFDEAVGDYNLALRRFPGRLLRLEVGEGIGESVRMRVVKG